MDCKGRYDQKVSASMGSYVPRVHHHIDEKSAIACLDRFRDKVKATGRKPQKTDSFIMALQTAYNSEEIYLMNTNLADEEKTPYLALINQGEKELLLSAPLELNLSKGDCIKWKRTQGIYMITSHSETEKSYFKGDIKKANYLIKWEDENDNVYEQYAVVEGPAETKLKSEQESNFYMDRANETITVMMKQTAATAVLKRYKRIIIKNKAWEITVVDDITSDSVVKLNCIEAYINTSMDDIQTGVVGGKDNRQYKLTTNLDNMEELLVGMEVIFEPILYKDGIAIDADYTYTIESLGNQTGDSIILEGNKFIVKEPGLVRIEIKPEGYPIESAYMLDVVETLTDNKTSIRISGNTRLKQEFEETYFIEKYIDGIKQQVEGVFVMDNKDAVKIVNKTNNSITLKGDKIGKVVLTYHSTEGDSVYETINIVSMFE